MKKTFGCVFVVFVCVISAGLASGVEKDQVFTKFEVKAYSSPTFDSQQVEDIPAGTALNILSSQDVWIKVKTPKGSEGWLAKKWITGDKNELIKLQNLEEQKRHDRLKELETKAKDTPDSLVYDKRNIYRELVRINPGNIEYKTLLKRYENEISKTVNFRQTRWGMSQGDVLKIETGTPSLKNSDLLIFPSRLDKKAVDIVYIFASNKLVRAKYLLKEVHTNRNDFIIDYNDLKSLLIKKYGTPKIDDKVWKNSIFKGDSENEGVAIGSGGLTYFASWKSTPTDIVIVLDGDNYQVQCTIEYTSNEYSSLESEENAKEALNDL